MDDEKKKKKNKKKKNKQSKTSVDVAQSANENQNNRIGQNHYNQVSETTAVHNDVPETDMSVDKGSVNGTEGLALAEADKLYWVDREAHLEAALKELREENDVHMQKKAGLEDAIMKLQMENDKLLQNEASLEDTIKRFEKENDTHLQKAASFEMELLHFQSEKESWLRLLADLEKKIVQLTDETTTLSSQRMSLEEKVRQLETERDCWVQEKNSMKETIAGLNNDNTRLQTQVMELGEYRNRLLQENQHLTENMSGLQSQIQYLERTVDSSPKSATETVHTSGDEEINAQLEVAGQLVEKLVVENAELVEKVNELYAELDKRDIEANFSSAVASELTDGTAKRILVADATSEETMSAPGERMDSPSDMLIEEERNGSREVTVRDTVHAADSMSEKNGGTSLSGEKIESVEDVATTVDTNVIPIYPDTIDPEEIVQIPLDDNEAGDTALMSTHDDDQTTDVPLTDAPLIGAPFRLISFVAKYVSGADLVNKSSVNTGILSYKS